MKLLFIKSQGGVLIPADAECIENMQKVKNNETIMIEYKPKRNIFFHRKAFALLNLVLWCAETYTSGEVDVTIYDKDMDDSGEEPSGVPLRFAHLAEPLDIPVEGEST